MDIKKKPVKIRHPPLTSITQLERTRKEQNNLNKQRSKAMERRIAAQLRGRRVPMSGAAAKYKGDVEIPLYNNPGTYIIECKMSAARTLDDNPSLYAQFKWFPKIHEEARSMNAKFAVMVIHFHTIKIDYVFIRMQTVELLVQRYTVTNALKVLAESAQVYDWRTTQAGKLRVGYTLTHKELQRCMHTHEGLRGFRVQLPDSEYICLEFESFKECVREL